MQKVGLFGIVYESEKGCCSLPIPIFARFQFRQNGSVGTFGSVYLRTDNTRPLCESDENGFKGFPSLLNCVFAQLLIFFADPINSAQFEASVFVFA